MRVHGAEAVVQDSAHAAHCNQGTHHSLNDDDVTGHGNQDSQWDKTSPKCFIKVILFLPKSQSFKRPQSLKTASESRNSGPPSFFPMTSLSQE